MNGRMRGDEDGESIQLDSRGREVRRERMREGGGRVGGRWREGWME